MFDMDLNMPRDLSEYGKVLNMAEFSIRKRYTAFWIHQNIPSQSLEYISGSKYARILNCKSYTGFLICHNMDGYAWLAREYAWIYLKWR